MKETNLYHLLTQHQVLIFLVSAVLIVALTLLVVAKLAKRSQKRRKRD